MNALYLSGFNISLTVDRAKLIVRDGIHEPDMPPNRIEIQPRNAHFDAVIIDSQSGMMSLNAVKWLMRHAVPVYVLDYDGTLLSSTLPREPVNGPLKIAQITAYNNPVKRFYIATKLIEAKTQRTIDVLDWLGSRYSDVDSVTDSIQLEMKRMHNCSSLPKLMQIEGHIADLYWRYLQKVLPKKFGFTSRMHESHQMNSADQVNTLLNFGFSILESQVRKALNSVGLETTIGFLHEAHQTRYALAYDLQEVFRWIVDVTVIESLEYDRFSKRDFYRLDNYVLRLKPEAVKKLLDALRIKFNCPVRYKDKLYGWDVIMRLKAQELAAFIINKRATISFEEPCPVLQRDDSETVREAILSLSAADARKLGIRRNTLWYSQQRVESQKPFRVYRKFKAKILE